MDLKNSSDLFNLPPETYYNNNTVTGFDDIRIEIQDNTVTVAVTCSCVFLVIICLYFYCYYQSSDENSLYTSRTASSAHIQNRHSMLLLQQSPKQTPVDGTNVQFIDETNIDVSSGSDVDIGV